MPIKDNSKENKELFYSIVIYLLKAVQSEDGVRIYNELATWRTHLERLDPVFSDQGNQPSKTNMSTEISNLCRARYLFSSSNIDNYLRNLKVLITDEYKALVPSEKLDDLEFLIDNLGINNDMVRGNDASRIELIKDYILKNCFEKSLEDLQRSFFDNASEMNESTIAIYEQIFEETIQELQKNEKIIDLPVLEDIIRDVIHNPENKELQSELQKNSGDVADKVYDETLKALWGLTDKEYKECEYSFCEDVELDTKIKKKIKELINTHIVTIEQGNDTATQQLPSQGETPTAADAGQASTVTNPDPTQLQRLGTQPSQNQIVRSGNEAVRTTASPREGRRQDSTAPQRRLSHHSQ